MYVFSWMLMSNRCIDNVFFCGIPNESVTLIFSVARLGDF